ncbi:MAG: peptidylprolyl isomerase [Bacteroidales bacterium]
MKKLNFFTKTSALLAVVVAMSMSIFADNIAEEVAWVVGDEPIFKSDIETQYMQMQYENVPIDGDPYCVIPEQLAIDKLFLHQAKLDTITVSDATVFGQVDSRITYFVNNLGSKEKVEEYFRKPLYEIRDDMIDMFRNQYIIQDVQKAITADIKATPSDVRKFYNNISVDSLPFIPMQVEVQIITVNPDIPEQEIEDVKAKLRDISDRVNNGESEFSTMAILYSEDGSSIYGGELGFKGKAEFVPEFANVAFNLNDTKKVSKVVETEFGYHIIQLIEKRGDKANVRHILMRPKVSDNDLEDAIVRLDSVKSDIAKGKFTFEIATQYISQDKDTKNNKGIMVNDLSGNTRFEMSQLPQDVSKVVNTMEVGEISEPFIMMDNKRNREVVALVKLTNRIDGHKANMSDDYQVLKLMYENAQIEMMIDKWVTAKMANTYVRIDEAWRDCEFKHDGWIKK